MFLFFFDSEYYLLLVVSCTLKLVLSLSIGFALLVESGSGKWVPGKQICE